MTEIRNAIALLVMPKKGHPYTLTGRVSISDDRETYACDGQTVSVKEAVPVTALGGDKENL